MPENPILTRDEVLELLTKRAREGSVSAAIALERALRAEPKSAEAWEAELQRFLGQAEEPPGD